METLVLDAALAVGFDDIADTKIRVQALATFSQNADFESSVLTFKRVANIIRKQGDAALSGPVDTALFDHDAERTLWAEVTVVEPQWARLAAAGEYSAMLDLLRRLKPAVDGFFDGVMVMCDDSAVRLNRLNVLRRVLSTLSQVADFGKLQV